VEKIQVETESALSHAVEDCLKAIFVLAQESKGASTSALAERLAISPAAVTKMVKKLAALRLADHSPYRGVTLTPAGEKIALEVIRHHRLLELYLQEALGFTWDQVHGEAERLEHVLSEEMEERIDALLGRPALDPHGDPIPSREGVLEPPAGIRLNELADGQPAVVARVRANDPELLRYLGRLGLYPGATVAIQGREPFAGPLFIRVGETEHAIGREVAESVYVHPTVEEVSRQQKMR
jgi:DtxR family transcriptional regulator, Mn-dependent transcriptional regulator